MQYAPTGWSQARVDAFNALQDAILAYMVYDYALTKLNVTDAVLLQRRTDIGNMILNVLGPAFRNS